MVARSARNDEGTAARILDTAEGLLQVRGYNGFSYADISAELGITKAALHYHFPGKADLGLALIGRYAGRFAGALAAIDTSGAMPPARLAGYAALYDQVLQQGRMCLCGMLAAEYQTLPPPMRKAVTGFFEANESWLEKVLDEGKQDGSLRFPGSGRDTARVVIACLEGALLVARPYDDTDRFQAMAQSLLDGLTRTGE
jgi:TetR/AcrR family transcriptional regulator, transcriptional repressor for nem operon